MKNHTCVLPDAKSLLTKDGDALCETLSTWRSAKGDDLSEKYCNFAIDHEGKTDELLEKLSAEQQERIYCKPPEGYATPKLTFAAVTVVFFLGCCAELFLLLGLLFSLVELFSNKHSLP